MPTDQEHRQFLKASGSHLKLDKIEKVATQVQQLLQGGTIEVNHVEELTIDTTTPLDVTFTNTELDVNVTNTELDVNVTNAELDVNVTNAELDVNVTNAELDVNVTNAELDVNVTNSLVQVNHAGTLTTVRSIVALQSITASGFGPTAVNMFIAGNLRIRGIIWNNPNTGNNRSLHLYNKLDAISTDIPDHSILMTQGRNGELIFPYNYAFQFTNLSVRCTNGFNHTTTTSNTDGCITILYA